MTLKDLVKTEKKINWEVNKSKRQFMIGAILSAVLLLGLCVAALFAKGSADTPCTLHSKRVCSPTTLREMYEFADLKVLDIEFYLLKYRYELISLDEVMSYIQSVQASLRLHYLILKAEEAENERIRDLQNLREAQ